MATDLPVHDRLNTAPCGFLSFTADGTLTTVNQTLLEMLGYGHDELVGGHVERIMTVGSRIFYQTHWFPLLRLHGHAEEIFLMFRSKSGEDVGVLVNAARRERGGVAEYECVAMRVRERQKYEDELLRARRAAEEANKAKSTFLAVMSHELRTPLNAIGGYVQILELGVHGPVTEAQREALDRIGQAGEHLLGLINDVLNLARIEAGHVEYAIEDVSVEELIETVSPMIEPQLVAKGIAYELAIVPGLRIRADREKVEQILLNLLSNAAKFTGAGGRVRIESDAAADPQGKLHIRVIDTGIGIPAEKLSAIFEPFVQVEDSRTRGSGGTGLGLAISRDLARGMNGDLAADSTIGKGSTFMLLMPIGG